MDRVIYSFAFLFLVLSCADKQSEVETTKLSAATFAEKVKKIENVQLVDVRTPEEFREGHLENALNIDWQGGAFKEQISVLDKSKPVFVYCRSGRRSASAAEVLRENGFEKVYEMPGGMIEWRSEGFPEKVIEAVE